MVTAAAKPPTKDMSAMAAPAHTECRDMLLVVYVQAQWDMYYPEYLRIRKSTFKEKVSRRGHHKCRVGNSSSYL